MAFERGLERLISLGPVGSDEALMKDIAQTEIVVKPVFSLMVLAKVNNNQSRSS